MSLRSLNRFLGRSKVDPNVEKAFEARQIEQLLAEYKFSSELFETLSEVKAESFDEFALLAYQIVSAAEEPDGKDDFPWPAEGLPRDDAASDEEKKVA
jgi:hypothetical protein